MRILKELSFEGAFLDQLMPMHVVAGSDGGIVHAGPTMKKLHRDGDIEGLRLSDVFDVSFPQIGATFEALSNHVGQRIKLRLRSRAQISLKAQAVPLCGGDFILLNMSFGIALTDAVAAFGLTMGDFDPTDLTVEMLYLMEAKSAVTQELKHLNTRLHGAKIAAEEQAFTDTLTGLKNRRALDYVLGRLVRRGDPFGLMHIDLDYFKKVNDTMGHAAGDAVLQRVAEVLILHTRVEDTVCRFGGDEFVILLPRLTDGTALLSIARRIIQGLEVPVPFEGQQCRISGSAGITTTLMSSKSDPDILLHDADMALYTSKSQGRARATLFDAKMHSAES